MSDKVKWAGIHFAVALVPVIAFFLARNDPQWAKNEVVSDFLVFAPIVGLLLAAILGWQINQTRIFWTSLLLFGAFFYFRHFPPGPFKTLSGSRAALEILVASLPLSLGIVVSIRETRLWSDRSLARLFLALSPLLILAALHAWAKDTFQLALHWGDGKGPAFLGVPHSGWATLALFVLLVFFLPDLKIKPFLAALAVALIPFYLTVFAGSEVLRVAATRSADAAWRSSWAEVNQLKQFTLILSFTAMTAILLHSVLHMYWRKVYMDILTGVPNRQALDERLHSLTGHYTLAMVDIDHFKKFNDTYGHSEGDNVLRMVAQHLEEHLGMRVYRYGGEEFCVVFEGGSPTSAFEMMDKTRHSLEKRKFKLRQNLRPKGIGGFLSNKPTRGGRIVHITFSSGVASSTGNDPEEASDVIKRADKALYVAKGKGRNRVAVDK